MRRPWLCPTGQILLLVGTFVGLTPAVAVASFPGGDGVIAYSAAHTSQPGIWAVDPATGNQLRLTSDATDEAPSFSASGNMLAFQRREHGVVTIYIAQADGSDATRLASGSEPAFSPDGEPDCLCAPDRPFPRWSGSRLGGTPDHQPPWRSQADMEFHRRDRIPEDRRRAGIAPSRKTRGHPGGT